MNDEAKERTESDGSSIDDQVASHGRSRRKRLTVRVSDLRFVAIFSASDTAVC